MRIALCGPAHVGKSTLCQYLWEEQGWNWIRYNDILKDWACKAINMYSSGYRNNINVADILEDKEKYRVLLQLLGDVWGFNEGNGVDEAIADWKHRMRPDRHVIFDNVRFQAQYDRLKEHGFVLVQLVRSDKGLDRARSAMSEAAVYHPAESQPLIPDLILNATGKNVEETADILMRLAGMERSVTYDPIAA